MAYRTYSIVEIEGIGKANAKKLAKAGIKTTGALLRECASKAGRKAGVEGQRRLTKSVF